MPESIRLDRFFSSQNLASRKEFRALLKQGRVTVNQTVPKSADQKVCPGLDRICLDGKEIGYQKYIYLMLNKPPGVVSATNAVSYTHLHAPTDRTGRRDTPAQARSMGGALLLYHLAKQ